MAGSGFRRTGRPLNIVIAKAARKHDETIVAPGRTRL
jgi:hypothetical protein